MFEHLLKQALVNITCFENHYKICAKHVFILGKNIMVNDIFCDGYCPTIKSGKCVCKCLSMEDHIGCFHSCKNKSLIPIQVRNTKFLSLLMSPFEEEYNKKIKYIDDIQDEKLFFRMDIDR